MPYFFYLYSSNCLVGFCRDVYSSTDLDKDDALPEATNNNPPEENQPQETSTAMVHAYTHKHTHTTLSHQPPQKYINTYQLTRGPSFTTWHQLMSRHLTFRLWMSEVACFRTAGVKVLWKRCTSWWVVLQSPPSMLTKGYSSFIRPPLHVFLYIFTFVRELFTCQCNTSFLDKLLNMTWAFQLHLKYSKFFLHIFLSFIQFSN